MTLRQRRLYADRQELQERFARAGSVLRVIETEGEPPTRYVIACNVDSLVSGPPRLLRGSEHFIEVILPADYPKLPPLCRMKSPIFHPNVDATSICIGDHWAVGERLSDLLIRVAEMLAYQSYNIRSPLNAVAAMWADLNSDKLPLDPRPLEVGF